MNSKKYTAIYYTDDLERDIDFDNIRKIEKVAGAEDYKIFFDNYQYEIYLGSIMKIIDNQRQAIVDNAIAINNVDEAYETSADYQQLLDRYITGEITSDDILKELHKKYQKVVKE